MNEQFSSVNWQSLKELCDKDKGASDFLEIIRQTVLQITLLHSPLKSTADSSSANSGTSMFLKEEEENSMYALKPSPKETRLL